MEHLILGSECLLLAVGHDQNLIDCRDSARPVGDHYGDAAARSNIHDCIRKRRLAVGIEIGIRLVEHDQEGIAIEGAGECYALSLASGERRATLTDLSLIAFRQG